MIYGYARVSLIFRWFDFWIGFYWDRKRRHLYFFPVPMVGLLVRFSFRLRCSFHKCGRPAEILCVRVDGYGPGGPFCSQHAQPGTCQYNDSFNSALKVWTPNNHIPLPEQEKYYFEDAA